MSEPLRAQFLVDRYWAFSHRGRPPETRFFRFLPDGRIGYYDHPNERFWCIQDGILCLLNDAHEVTTRFTETERVEGQLVLSGSSLSSPHVTLCLTEQGTEWPRFSETKRALVERICRDGWIIGEHTYGAPSFIDLQGEMVVIGRYTSIAGNVIFCFGNHRTDIVSSYPFITCRAFWPSVPLDADDHVSSGDLHIGNDVWIGEGAFIRSGITIGDGAVIGAKSVVTRDVPPYAILAGNPGRVIRHRFPEHVVAGLLEVAWWDWPDEVVDSYLPLMMSADVEAFLAAARTHGGVVRRAGG